MSNADKKERLEFNNIKEIQNIIKTSALSGLISGARKARSRIEGLMQSLKEKSAGFSAEAKKQVIPPKEEVKVEPVKVQKEVKPVVKPEVTLQMQQNRARNQERINAKATM